AAGFANRSVPADQLDDAVEEVAKRVSLIPADLLALNKRTVHRAMEAAGMRAGIRAGADIQAMGFHQESSAQYLERMREVGLTTALSERDAAFGDYRES